MNQIIETTIGPVAIIDDESKITPGDIVRVNFNAAQMTLCHEARVEYVPCGPGDSWIFGDLRTGETHYVSEGCTVTLLRKAELLNEL